MDGMMEDRKLLEMAAKATGLEFGGYCHKRGLLLIYASLNDQSSWNPLTDDGDAFRLAVKLKLSVIQIDDGNCRAAWKNNNGEIEFDSASDDGEAARRAIVRAAAAIGESI